MDVLRTTTESTGLIYGLPARDTPGTAPGLLSGSELEMISFPRSALQLKCLSLAGPGEQVEHARNKWLFLSSILSQTRPLLGYRNRKASS